MDKEILTTAIYKENCEYNQSEVTQKVLLPQQTVTVKLTVAPPTGDAFFYNDNITLNAIVFQGSASHPIQVGRIEFYYIPDKQATPILINKNTAEEITCKLNKNGSASVIFRPNTSCKVYARYVDDNEFYVNTDSEIEHIVLKDMPVSLNFTQTPPYITNVHDEISLEVQVKDANNTPVKYGTVTFMHYLDYDDIENPNKRVPKIIGNPVPIGENGKATIQYIPVQTDDYLASEIEELIDNNNNKHFVEYVRASYNYMGRYNEDDEYTESYCTNCYTINYNADTQCAECGGTSMTYWTDYKWKYYGTDSEWTGINVCARNTITINPLSLHTDGNTSVYKCSETDTITLTAQLLDKDGVPINFANHEGSLTFHINGAHAHPIKQYTNQQIVQSYTNEYEKMMSEFQFDNIKLNISASFNNSTNCFTAQLPKLLPGYYTISATSSIQIDNLTTNNNNILINNVQGTANVEDDKYYAEVNDSNIIYLVSSYVNTSYDITVHHDTNYVQTKNVLNNLNGKVINLSNKQMQILNNKPCYFYVHELNTRYMGKLSFSNNELIGTPTEDIIFDIPNDYHISMIIPTGTYSNSSSDVTHSSSNTYDFYLPYPHASNTVTIQARDNPELYLSINNISGVAPGYLDYHLSSNYLNDSLNVKIMARLSNESSEHEIDSVTLNKYLTYIDRRVDTPLNMIGEIICYAKVGNIRSNEITFEVNKDVITQEIAANSLNMLAQINNPLGVYIHTQADNIRNIGTITNNNSSSIFVYLYDENLENQTPITIDLDSIRIIDNNTMYFNVKPEIYTEGNWYLQIKHKGNSKIELTECEPSAFTTFLYEPQVVMYPYYNNYNVEITNIDGIIEDNIIAAIVVFNQDNTTVGRGILITDKKGVGTFYDEVDNHETIPWWNNWNNVTFIFNPFDTETINAIKNANDCRDVLKNKFQNVFDYHHYTNDYNFKMQVTMNSDYIFSSYKPYQIKLPRPSAL